MKRLLCLILTTVLLLSVSVPALALEVVNENYWTEAEAKASGLSAFTDSENYAVQSGESAFLLFGLKDAAGKVIWPATLVDAEALPGTDYLIVYDKEYYDFSFADGLPSLIDKSGKVIGTFWDVSYNADDEMFVIWHVYEEGDNFYEFYYLCDKQLNIVLKSEDGRIERTEPNTYLVRGQGLYVPGQGFIESAPIAYHLLENLYLSPERNIITADGTVLVECGDKNIRYEFSPDLMDWRIWVGETEYRLSDLQSSLPTTGPALFADVLSSDYFFAPVLWAVNENITAGTSATTFSPHQTCTRAQILTFLWRAAGRPQAAIANPFADISEADYYYGAALWAAEKGMVSGNMFQPATPCTRGESITYIWKAANQPTAAVTSGFTDIAAGTETAQAADWAKEAAVTAGTTATTFAPDATCTRAQIITFLYRAFAI